MQLLVLILFFATDPLLAEDPPQDPEELRQKTEELIATYEAEFRTLMLNQAHVNLESQDPRYPKNPRYMEIPDESYSEGAYKTWVALTLTRHILSVVKHRALQLCQEYSPTKCDDSRLLEQYAYLIIGYFNPMPANKEPLQFSENPEDVRKFLELRNSGTLYEKIPTFYNEGDRTTYIKDQPDWSKRVPFDRVWKLLRKGDMPLRLVVEQKALLISMKSPCCYKDCRTCRKLYYHRQIAANKARGCDQN